jgi:hypothetical protein
VGDEVRALEGIDGDVDPRHLGVREVAADPLADVEHRGFVALALADDDPAAELDLVHGPAHRLGGRGVRRVALAATHEPRRVDGRRLGDPDHLEGEQLLHRVSLSLLGHGARGRRATGQCRKWRRPVKTIAMWWRSATSIAISSRIEPPGWMIAVTPAVAAAWIPSGERESRRRTPSRPSLARSPARRTAISTETSRLAWPGADPDRRAVPREHDRVRAHVAHRAPREQEVGQLLERRAAAG